jgi:hypothetical protein
MKYVCIESTLDFSVGYLKIRVWRNETAVKNKYSNQDIIQATRKLYRSSLQSQLSIKPFAELVAKMPRVNAVQVIDLTTNEGIVLYTNW